MEKNFSIIARDLFGKIRTQFPSVKLGNKSGKVTSKPEDARFFEFDYDKDGRNLGTITISLSADGMAVMYSNNIVDKSNSQVRAQWFKFLRSLRDFAKRHLLNFDTRDITKSNLEKRDYEELAKRNGGSPMAESKLQSATKLSYQTIGESRLVVKHSKPIDRSVAANRARNIESIYIENAQGERFRYPCKHLNGARAMARHVSNGGTPYDQIGEHLIGLSEELGKLRMFKGYVERNDAISESMDAIHPKVLNRISEIKKTVSGLQNQRFYEAFTESFTPVEPQDIPEDVMNDWISRLTIKTFNEELTNVLPYIYNLVNESDLPVVTLSAEDLVTEDQELTEMAYDSMTHPKYGKIFWMNHGGAHIIARKEPNGSLKILAMGTHREIAQKWKSVKDKVSPSPEARALEQTLGSISESDDNSDGILSADKEVRDEAVGKLKELLAQDFLVGADGTNAIESLAGIINDTELHEILKELSDVSPEMDASQVILDYVRIKDEENGTNIYSELTEEEPEEEEPEEEEPEEEPAESVSSAMEADSNRRMFEELTEFIGSMYNKEEGSFPKGETGVLLACEKKFGERVTPVAAKIVERMSSVGEMSRLRELAGMQTNEEHGYDKYEEMKDRIASVFIKLYNSGKNASDFAQMADVVARKLGYDPEDKIFKQAFSSSLHGNDWPEQDDDDDEYTDFTMRRGESGRIGDLFDDTDAERSSESQRVVKKVDQPGGAGSEFKENVELSTILRIAGLK